MTVFCEVSEKIRGFQKRGGMLVPESTDAGYYLRYCYYLCYSFFRASAVKG